ncbi:ROK family protein [Acidithiobacillus sp. CV18-2]|nr:ROK family protein [Acidithiobacillus sp. CV18-3]MBU2758565.1 ROK family protein [Acidithiobacillus sp. BN09-2]MBU2776892.1 ROK family protein [Acidithiobacillus sp. CV18-2]MBU2800050.1 ROK family protein [Acidithiobacillus sp. VAN18-4]
MIPHGSQPLLAKPQISQGLEQKRSRKHAAGLRLGIDVGGTNLRIGVFLGLHLVCEYRTTPRLSEVCAQAPDSGKAKNLVVELLEDAISNCLRDHQAVQQIGLAIPGLVDPNGHLLLQSPNLPHLQNVDFVTPLQNRFGVKVALENDANAAAYGEYLLAQKNQPSIQNLLYVGLGTGVGGGAVLNGHIFRGTHGYAMEMGHLIVEPDGRLCGCGNRGCLEQYASASGVERSYLEFSGHHRDARHIGQLAEKGNKFARMGFNRAGHALGQALAHVLKILDIDQVVIGGGLAGSWQWIAPTFEHAMSADLIPVLRDLVQIRTSHGADCAGILGAAHL